MVSRILELTLAERLTLLLTFAALVVTIAAFVVIIIPLRVMKRQTALAEKQDELLAQRSKLEMIVMPVVVGANSTVFRFEAKNRGTKSARDFYWHIWVPTPIFGVTTIAGRNDQNYSVRGTDVVGGVSHNQLSDCIHDPVYPTRSLPIVTLEIPRPFLSAGQAVRWRLVDEDGVFPVQSDRLEDAGIIHLA